MGAAMTRGLSADEVLAMAEQVERNGSAFYAKAASLAADEGMKQLFAYLSEFEADHESLFIRLRASLPDEQRTLAFFEADSEADAFFRATADTLVFKADADVDELPAGLNTPAEIIAFAVKMEADLILLYMALRSSVLPELGRRSVDDLINEEISHVASLKRKLDIADPI
jgi:rubrerythrin